MKWKKYETVKGRNLLSGYIAQEFYLDIDEELSPVVSNTVSTNNESLNEFNKVFQDALNELLSESKLLGIKENEMKSKAEETEKHQKRNKELERKLNSKIYNLYYDVLYKAWFDSSLAKGMGEIFFDDCLRRLISAGVALGKTEDQVKIDVCYYLVSIYSDLDNWEKAYEYLIIQAYYNSWVSIPTIKKVVKKYNRHYRLKGAIEYRLNENDLSSKHRKVFKEALEYLESL